MHTTAWTDLKHTLCSASKAEAPRCVSLLREVPRVGKPRDRRQASRHEGTGKREVGEGATGVTSERVSGIFLGNENRWKGETV